MFEDFAGLLLALAGLNPSQFLILSLGLVASDLAVFLALERPQSFGVNIRPVLALSWALTLCFTPNDAVYWYHYRTAHYTLHCPADCKGLCY